MLADGGFDNAKLFSTSSYLDVIDRATGNNPPMTGYPITVSDEGKITLPYTDPTIAQGSELSQLTDVVQQAYRDNKILIDPAVNGITVELLMRANKPCEIENLTEGSNVDAQPK